MAAISFLVGITLGFLFALSLLGGLFFLYLTAATLYSVVSLANMGGESFWDLFRIPALYMPSLKFFLGSLFLFILSYVFLRLYRHFTRPSGHEKPESGEDDE